MPDVQGTFDDCNDEYRAFVDKFKPKKTTDDCYTPANVYEAVIGWVCNRYGVDRKKVLRPFWPGADYEKADYPDGAVVVDNPPFSILSRIVKFYLKNGIKFFLFGPGLTIFGSSCGACSYVVTGTDIVYQNGANVNTGFVHNLGDRDIVAESAPDLGDLIEAANKENLRAQKKEVRKLALPDNVITAARLGYYAGHHTGYAVRRRECRFIRKLDNLPGGIFGGGLVLSEKAAAEKAAAEKAAAEKAAAEKAAAEKAAAERVELSAREKELLRLAFRQA